MHCVGARHTAISFSFAFAFVGALITCCAHETDSLGPEQRGCTVMLNFSLLVVAIRTHSTHTHVHKRRHWYSFFHLKCNMYAVQKTRLVEILIASLAANKSNSQCESFCHFHTFRCCYCCCCYYYCWFYFVRPFSLYRRVAHTIFVSVFQHLLFHRVFQCLFGEWETEKENASARATDVKKVILHDTRIISPYSTIRMQEYRHHQPHLCL